MHSRCLVNVRFLLFYMFGKLNEHFQVTSKHPNVWKENGNAFPILFLLEASLDGPVIFLPENSCLLFHRLPKNNLQKCPHQFQVTLDNCLEGTHIWKKNIQMEYNCMINPLTPLHGCLKSCRWVGY